MQTTATGSIRGFPVSSVIVLHHTSLQQCLEDCANKNVSTVMLPTVIPDTYKDTTYYKCLRVLCRDTFNTYMYKGAQKHQGKVDLSGSSLYTHLLYSLNQSMPSICALVTSKYAYYLWHLLLMPHIYMYVMQQRYCMHSLPYWLQEPVSTHITPVQTRTWWYDYHSLSRIFFSF